jgi:tRNA-dihydrouridine synthase A
MSAPTDTLDRRFCVAPMIEWTDRHCRTFHRTLTRRALLYTEMAVDQAVVRGDTGRLIGFSPGEQPVALQLGGSDPALLARAARIGADLGYVEINLNVGCPSDRVQSGRFGACLMREPELVRDCLAAMREAVDVPVTVKHRLGVDDQDPGRTLLAFVDTVATSGVRTFIVHARKAWLQGLSPKQNRQVPPLDHDLVRRLKRERPHLEIVLNGGIGSLDAAVAASAGVDGVMLGRTAYQDPWQLAGVDRRIFGEPADRHADRAAAVRALRPYVEGQLARGVRLHAITRHWLGLFAGCPGARHWRRRLADGATDPTAGWPVVERALAAVSGRRVPEVPTRSPLRLPEPDD